MYWLPRCYWNTVENSVLTPWNKSVFLYYTALSSTLLTTYYIAQSIKFFFNWVLNIMGKGEPPFLLFPLFECFNPFPNENFRFSLTERDCRRQFWIWRKWQKVHQKSRKHCGKRRNCLLRAISPFPIVFSKDLYCRHIKTRASLGKG